jgi:cell division protein FtsA
MARPHETLIAILDIGTSKVVCFIARLNPEGTVEILGIGHQLSQGIRGGAVTDIAAAKTSILSTLHIAEQMAERRIERVVISLSGCAPKSYHLYGELPIGNRPIGESDVQKLLHQARLRVEDGQHDILHCTPLRYLIDNEQRVQDPRGMYGKLLSADVHITTVASGAVRNLTHCVAQCQLDIADYVLAPYASGLGVLTEDELQLGVTVIDIGGASTGISMFTEGQFVFSDVIPMGGRHITNDIAKGLSTSMQQAERIKAIHGSAIPMPSDTHEMLHVPTLGEDDPDEPNMITRAMLVSIIRPRVEEIFEIVRSKIQESGADAQAGHRVVLTGGGSQLMGIREFVAQHLNAQVRMGRPIPVAGLAESTAGPSFATALGLLEYARRQAISHQAHGAHHPTSFREAVAKMVQWVKENI